ncbi:MAG: hypothetical protein RR566_08205 [Comamonas sp.]
MNVEDAVLSSTSQHRCTMSPCSITRPATAQGPAGQCINLHKKRAASAVQLYVSDRKLSENEWL